MKITILGGYGKMGRWFASYLKREGNDIILAGRDPHKLIETAELLGVKSASNAEAVSFSDAVILSVPIDSFEKIVEDIAPHTHEGQLIFDVTSIKSKPVEIMHRYIKKGIVLGVHPMFGPGAADIKGQRFVLTPVGEEEEALAGKVKGYLENKGANVAIMTPGEHDEIMSIVLGLSHFIALVSADALVSLDKLTKSREIGGSTYRMLLTMAQAVVSEAPEFYSSLQLNLPGLVEKEKLFHEKAGQWAALVSQGKRQEFIDRMNDLKRAFEKDDPRFSSAYRDMYKLIDG